MFILNGDNVLRGLLLATVGATTCLDDDRLVVVVLSVPRSANLGKLDDDEESSEEPEPTDEEDRALILPNGGRERSGIGKCTDFLSISELRRVKADDDDPPEPCVRRIGLLLLRRLLRLLFEWCDATDMQSLSSTTGGGYCGMDVPISGSSIILCGCSTCSC